jgi:hypothetical protein
VTLGTQLRVQGDLVENEKNVKGNLLLASLLVSSEVDIKTVSSMLRHCNVKTALGIYSYAVDSNRLAAQEQFLNTLRARNSQ